MMTENVSINTEAAVDECEAELVIWFIFHKKGNVLFYPIFLFNFLMFSPPWTTDVKNRIHYDKTK